jgi:C1A family cysteine protease
VSDELYGEGKFTYGWIRDLPDIRDHVLSSPPTNLSVPDKVDLRSEQPPIYDQGSMGSCTAQSICGIVEYDMMKQKKDDVFTPSRLYLYYNERYLLGQTGYDYGATIRSGMKALNSWGYCNEGLWPYRRDLLLRRPSSSCYVAGRQTRITEYARVNQGLLAMQAQLAEGNPITFGFSVYSSFQTREVASTGIVPMPRRGEYLLGGHAVTIVGYDNESSRFLIRNSWGVGWGQKGYCTMPYDFILNPNLAADFWVVKLIP